jgi:hypothetical protein
MDVSDEFKYRVINTIEKLYHSKVVDIDIEHWKDQDYLIKATFINGHIKIFWCKGEE